MGRSGIIIPMGREGPLKRLSREHVDYRVSLKAVGRLGFDAEPRGTVTTTILDVFHTRTIAKMLDLAQERDGKITQQPSLVTSLSARMAEVEQNIPEHERIRPFKIEVVEELIRARIPGHTYLDAIATMCSDILTELYTDGFDDRKVITTTGL